MPNFHEIEDIATVLDLAQLSLHNSKSWKLTSKLSAKWQKLEDSQRKFISIINDIYVTLYRIIVYLYEKYKKKYKIHHRHRSPK